MAKTGQMVNITPSCALCSYEVLKWVCISVFELLPTKLGKYIGDACMHPGISGQAVYVNS